LPRFQAVYTVGVKVDCAIKYDNVRASMIRNLDTEVGSQIDDGCSRSFDGKSFGALGDVRCERAEHRTRPHGGHDVQSRWGFHRHGRTARKLKAQLTLREAQLVASINTHVVAATILDEPVATAQFNDIGNYITRRV
jgi:hypothetical protein